MLATKLDVHISGIFFILLRGLQFGPVRQPYYEFSLSEATPFQAPTHSSH